MRIVPGPTASVDETGWSNWAGNVASRPVAVLRPRSTGDVSRIVAEARGAGQRVKAVGSGHSFAAIAQTDGVLLDLDGMRDMVAVDTASGRVRVEAGITLRELNRRLDAQALALPNLGDIDAQTLAGAIATGTHGTGGRHHGIATAVAGLRLVTGTGDVVDLTDGHPWFGAATVSLGALGVVTEVTLQCVPAFDLHAREEPAGLTETLAAWPELVAENDHVEFYWFPHTDRTLLKRNNRLATGAARPPLGRVRRLVDDELLSNGGFALVNRLARGRPALIPRLNEISGRALTAREYVDVSHRVFVSPRRVRFRESEFAVPRAALPDVIADLTRWFAVSGERLAFPLEIRCTAADEPWLSTSQGRDSVYVAVHQHHRMDPTVPFRAAADVFRSYDGRPHWGKEHPRDAAELSGLYPRFDNFLTVRDAADPDRLLANPYLDRVLGR